MPRKPWGSGQSPEEVRRCPSVEDYCAAAALACALSKSIGDM
ncbi:MAG: hypothetical protein ACK58T_34905 [Phycisphaerae bacterium]